MTIAYPKNSSVSVTLDRGSVLDLVPPSNGLTIDVRDGSLWITQSGDPADHMLRGGQSFRTQRPGLVVVQALETSEMKV